MALNLPGWVQTLLGLMVVFTPLTPAFAQDLQLPRNYRHIVGNHVFLSTSAFPSTFADSHANLQIGLGYGDYTVATLSGGTTDVNLGSFAPAIEGQFLFLSRFAFSFSLTGNLVAGLNTASALQYGASTSYSINAALLYEVLRSDQAVLSLGLAVNRPHTLSLSPLAATIAAIETAVGNVNSEYASSTARTQWKPSIRFSYALSPVFGLRSLLGLNFINFAENRPVDTNTRLNIGIGFEADLAPITPVPLALTANYARGQILTPGVPNSDTLTFGLFETISPAFNAGVEIGKTWTNNVSSTLVSASLRAYYN